MVCLIVVSERSAQAEPLDFNRDIKPILSNRCFFCHGPDEEERQGGDDGLRLDTYEGATADIGGRAAIVPGDWQQSGLIERVTTDDLDLVMPPAEHGQPLSADEVDRLKRWIEQGAPYAAHWSYVPPVRPELPAVKDSAWPRNEVDRFILAALEHRGLKPSAEADRATLARRLALDLTGLPPTIEQVERLVADPSPEAYERYVDQLLEQPTFGEHWARLWLDLARYADSAGYADDPGRTIWLYRDYVIRAFNENKPFDQFTVEQLAGDLMPNPTDDQLIATAFHRNTLTNNEGGTSDEEFRNAAIVDRVNTTLAVWMGTTMACAQCHTHKYDPITQEEYFRVFAILNNTADADRRDESPLHSVLTEAQRRDQTQWQQQLEKLEAELLSPTPEWSAELAAWEASIPVDVSWKTLVPTQVTSTAGSQVKVDGSTIIVAKGSSDQQSKDTYRITTALDQPLRALRLEALPDAALPSSGPGHGGGNFVVTGIKASVQPATSQPMTGRYVRVEIPGNEKMLSLAEVQVMHQDQNRATQGTASQSSTGFDGPASLAIDGNTNGQYTEAKSTTHTQITADPWWELDLKSTMPIDRLVIWNRTDPGTVERLSNFVVSVLDEQRQIVWQQQVQEPPRPSQAFEMNSPRELRFVSAFADYSQPGFEASNLVSTGSTNPPKTGWAVGGQPGKAHVLTLLVDPQLALPTDGLLTVEVEQQSPHAFHTIGSLRLSATDQPQVEAWRELPGNVLTALAIAKAQRSADQQAVIEAHYRTVSPRLAPLRKQIDALKNQLAELKPVTVPVMRELPDQQRRKTQIQLRGNFMNLGKVVEPGLLDSLFPTPNSGPIDRVALAKWLVDDRNPLTSRVLVNRYWEKIFGTGLVSTVEDFGSQGSLPSNPELLDWLATEVVRLKWNNKAIIKLLVMSAAYRQSSAVTDALYELDPDNQLLARGPRMRLSAETIRDQALAVSGLLSPKMFGPPVNPPQPSSGLSAAFGGNIDWTTSSGEDRYRRALYTTWRRSNPYPSMVTFDAPNREVCTLRRSRSNTPLQALVTLNDPVYMEAAQGLARRVLRDGGSDLRAQIGYVFALCLARQPSEQETERLIQLHQTVMGDLKSRPAEALRLATDPLGSLPESLEPIDAAAWTVIANVMLNLDEFIMPR